MQVPSGRTWTEIPHEAAQTPQEHGWKNILELWADEEKHRRYQQEEEKKNPSHPEVFNCWLRFQHLCPEGKEMDNHSSCGGKGGFVELHPVKGDKKRPVPLSWWPVMAFLVPSVPMGSNDNHQWDGMGLKRLW